MLTCHCSSQSGFRGLPLLPGRAAGKQSAALFILRGPRANPPSQSFWSLVMLCRGDVKSAQLILLNGGNGFSFYR